MILAWRSFYDCAPAAGQALLIYVGRTTCATIIKVRPPSACLWEIFVDKRVCIVIKRKGCVPECFDLLFLTVFTCCSPKSFVINFTFAQRCSWLAPTTCGAHNLSLIFVRYYSRYFSVIFRQKTTAHLRSSCAPAPTLAAFFDETRVDNFQWILLISLTANLAHYVPRRG